MVYDITSHNYIVIKILIRFKTIFIIKKTGITGIREGLMEIERL